MVDDKVVPSAQGRLRSSGHPSLPMSSGDGQAQILPLA